MTRFFFFGFLVLITLFSFQLNKDNSRFSELNKMSSKDSLNLQIRLGRMLFYDKTLSRDSTISCSSCHIQSLAFADTLPISFGIKGRKPNRNTPTLTNIVSNTSFMFDGFLETLEKQIIVPLEEHNEMDFSLLEVTKRFSKNKKYQKIAFKVFKRKLDPYVITRSIAAFERTIISNSSKYDLVLNGKQFFSPDEKEGAELFFNKLNCAKCHSGSNFSNYLPMNNGLEENYLDEGRMRATQKESDRALFKVPTLRNISITKPYMHDGSMTSLLAVIRHYETGGKKHANKSELLQAFQLTENQEQQLIAFLFTLTDQSFLKDKALSDLKR